MKSSNIESSFSVIHCEDCGYYNLENGICNRPAEGLVLRDPKDFCSRAQQRVDQIRFHIEDFFDFNYRNIAFDITGVNKFDLINKLRDDYINHLYELDNANYIAIANCDLQGFEHVDDVFFESDSDEFILCKLVKVGEVWFYDIIDKHKKIRPDLLMM